MKSRSEKLPRSRSHPVKATILSAAVAANGITLPVELTNWDRFDHAFQADFMPHGWPGREQETIWVHCRAVPFHRAAEARQAVEHEAIPQFIEWARSIDVLDASSPIRREKQTFRYSLERFAD